MSQVYFNFFSQANVQFVYMEEQGLKATPQPLGAHLCGFNFMLLVLFPVIHFLVKKKLQPEFN